MVAGKGLCCAVITMQARHLLSTVCIGGGADCPLLSKSEAESILSAVKSDPTVTIQLTSTADEISHYTAVDWNTSVAIDPASVFDRKRDLDVLQRLGLVPGSIRRSRYLYELLFARIQTPFGICAYDTPGWEGCPLARNGAYERVRAKGWQAIVYVRSQEEMRAYRARNIATIERPDRLYLRPHHLMCLACWHAGGAGEGPRPNDTLYEILQRIRKDPEVLITLVEGCCMACDCCDGFYPRNRRCMHPCGLIRDYKKDLDVFQKLGLMPGATMNARELFALLFERIHSTRQVCGYGDGVVTAEEWRICGDARGEPGYEKTRRTSVF
jgi:hypothetical protein